MYPPTTLLHTQHMTRHHTTTPQDVNAMDERGLTAVHHALSGFHDHVMEDHTKVKKAQHIEAIKQLTSYPSFNASVVCIAIPLL